MSSWFSEMNLPEHPLGYHEALAANERPPQLSADVYDQMLRSHRLGIEHDGPSHGQTTEMKQRHDPVVADLLAGAFLCGNGIRGNGDEPRKYPPVWFACEGCAGIKRLVRAFLAMGRRDRERAFVAAKVAKHHTLEIGIVGALCEARAASVLLGAGLTVLESTVDEDVNLGIDAIALLPGALDGHLVQVKGDRNAAGIEFLRVERCAESRETWEKTERFNRAYAVTFSPVSVRVGTGNGDMFNFNSPADAHAAQQFLSALRDPS